MILEAPLIAIIVREAALRSTLVARFALAGAEVMTVESFQDPKLSRTGDRRLVLIADGGALDAHDGGAQLLLDDPRLFRLVEVGEAQAASPDMRHVRIDRALAARASAEMLLEWQKATA